MALFSGNHPPAVSGIFIFGYNRTKIGIDMSPGQISTLDNCLPWTTVAGAIVGLQYLYEKAIVVSRAV